MGDFVKLDKIKHLKTSVATYKYIMAKMLQSGAKFLVLSIEL
jgi:hypothetical protein